MKSKPTKQSKHKPKTKLLESDEFGRHSIVIRQVEQEKSRRKQLLIDGKNVPFVESQDGFIVFYEQAETLMEAARNYVKRRFATDRAGGEE